MHKILPIYIPQVKYTKGRSSLERSHHEPLHYRTLGYMKYLYIIYWEMITCFLIAHVKNSNNRNNVLEIVLIYCSKCLILIFFSSNFYH